MWNNRFEALSGDPFDGSEGFSFPAPEGDERFSAAENRLHDVQHLLQAQAHILPTELIEVGAFEGVCPGGVPEPGIDSRLCQFDVDGPGLPVPLPDSSGFRNEPIRQVALAALNANAEYRKRFGQVFKEVKAAPGSTSSCSARRSRNSSSLSSLPMRRSIVSRAATRTR